MTKMMLFAGNANPALAEKISEHLKVPLGKATVGRFSDGEIMVEILENVRGKSVYILQSTCHPTNENLMELIIMADALRRASASPITAVVPYFGYGRQDKRVRSARVPITAKVVADMMASVGINRLLTVDLHADQIQGFFYMPVDNVYGTSVMLDHIRRQHYTNPIIVSPDVGGVIRARAAAKRLDDADLAIIDKRRPQPNQSQVMNIIGDVKNRTCLLVDDMIDTGGTLYHAAEALKEHGALAVIGYCTHPVLSGPAIKTIVESSLDKLIVSDTIPLTAQATACKKIQQISLSEILAQAIRRVDDEESVSSMFLD